MREGDPNFGGNHRKNPVQALDASLRRLGTDYVDILWLHAWDYLTPPGPGQGDRGDAGSGQPPWAKVSSAGGVPRGRRW